MNSTRRDFFKKASLAAAALTLGLGTRLGQVWAQALEYIDITGEKRKDEANTKALPTAKGLGYVDDADATEKAGKLKRTDKPVGAATAKAAQQNCGTCSQFGKTHPEECTLIQGVKVRAKGYCNAYTPEPTKFKK